MLSWQQSKHYMLQLVQAVLHLHTLGVVYLNWHS